MPAGQAVRQLSTGPSLSEQAYQAVRQMIVDGTLTPGERLTERSLGGMLGVSPTPVREAFRRLEQERLIERRDSRTVTVAAPTEAQLRKLSLIQTALRGVAARLAAEGASDAELAEIAAASRRGIDLSRRRAPAAAQVACARGLHELIDRAAHSQPLTDMIATTTAFGLAERVRAAQTLGEQYPAAGLTEHERIVEALLARDGARAEELMRAHLGRSGEFFLSLRRDAGLLDETGAGPARDDG